MQHIRYEALKAVTDPVTEAVTGVVCPVTGVTNGDWGGGDLDAFNYEVRAGDGEF